MYSYAYLHHHTIIQTGLEYVFKRYQWFYLFNYPYISFQSGSAQVQTLLFQHLCEIFRR